MPFSMSLACTLQGGLSAALPLTKRAILPRLFSRNIVITVIVAVPFATAFALYFALLQAFEGVIDTDTMSLPFYLCMVGVMTWFDVDALEDIVSLLVSKD